jgi:hypothetical protein
MKCHNDFLSHRYGSSLGGSVALRVPVARSQESTFVRKTKRKHDCLGDSSVKNLRGRRPGPSPRLARYFFFKCCVMLLSIGSIVCSMFALETSFPDLRVEKKPGARTGSARIMLKGKSKILARNALQAWQIMDGENALVLVAVNKHGVEKYRLHLYEGRTRRYRDLGVLPLFTVENLVEAKQNDGSWAVALSGTLEGKPAIVISGLDGVQGLLPGAGSPKLQEDSMSFVDGSGQARTIPVKALIGSDMTGIYERPASLANSNKVRHLQFLRNGTALLMDDGQFRSATWMTNGENMIVTDANGSQMVLARTSLIPTTGIPAGTRLDLRMLQPLESENIREGDPVEAVLISPANVQNAVLIPQGSIFSGRITQAHGVGWGLRHETAAITLEFSSVKLPDGTELSIHARLDQVENSRETVNEKGSIRGIRSTGTPAYSVEGKISSVASLDPVAYLFANVASTATLGFADPEIRYPAGTEILIQFVAPVITSRTYPRAVPQFPDSERKQQDLTNLVKNLSFRTATAGSRKPSDLTNLVFIGSADGLRRAFAAAGWATADQRTAGSTFLTMKSVGGNEVYNQAPMSTLLLNDRPPILNLTKTTNSFASRHHLRVFDPATTYEGVTVLTSSSTQDIRVAFSRKQKTFIHVIDEYIDNERSKVVDDLEFTGCVEAMSLIPRPWVPHDTYNATGDRLLTDGAIAVLKISNCENPNATPDTPAKRPDRFKRTTRNTMLAIRNDLYRGNLLYTGVSGVRSAANYFATKNEVRPLAGAWRITDQSGTIFRGSSDVPIDEQDSDRIDISDAHPNEMLEQQARELELTHRWDPPHYEIGIYGGYMRYPYTRAEAVQLTVVPDNSGPSGTYDALLADDFLGGWTAGISVTLNSWKWFSNQFSYSYTRGRYNFYSSFSEPVNEEISGSSGLVTRQFEYALLWNLRPPESRWRPYVALGPALVLTSLADSPIKKAAGPFKLGLNNVGLFLAAYSFGNTAPLNGGGVFSPGLVYGTGFKYRLRPRIALTADFRETFSRAPQFLSDSYTRGYFDDVGYAVELFRSTTDAKYRQQRFTTGIAFTF